MGYLVQGTRLLILQLPRGLDILGATKIVKNKKGMG